MFVLVRGIFGKRWKVLFIGVNIHSYCDTVQRLLLASFYHANDIHLYYNMSSFIWKGRQLEPIFGPKRFAILIIILALVSNILMVAISVGLSEVFQNSDSMHTCAVGFSAVLFALKVIITETSPSNNKWIYWSELLFIQMIVPNASFLGHLCGILAGLLYTHHYLDALFIIPEQIVDSLVQTQQQPAASQNNQYQSYDSTYNQQQQYNNYQNYQPGRRRVVNGVLY